MKKNADFIQDIAELWHNHQLTLIFIFFLIVFFILVIFNYILKFTSFYQNESLVQHRNAENLDKYVKTLTKQPKQYKKYETKCRQILEKAFQQPFPSIRPNWLKNPKTGRNLEIDCFNANLRLGLETNGAQHDHFVYHFHRTEDVFKEQQWRDAWKKQKCQDLGIYLIIVPHTIDFKNLESFVLNEIQLWKNLQNFQFHY